MLLQKLCGRHSVNGGFTDMHDGMGTIHPYNITNVAFELSIKNNLGGPFSL